MPDAPQPPTESIDEYLTRKSREVQLLSSRLNHGPVFPNLTSTGDVLRAKLEIRGRLLAQASIETGAVTETNLSSSPDVSVCDYAVSYSYQRMDLHVNCAVEYDPAATRGADVESAVSWYASSGMSAIAATLIGLEAAVSESAQIWTHADCYFETLEFLKRYCRKTTVTLCELETQLERGPSDPLNCIAGLVILYLDSAASSPNVERIAGSLDPSGSGYSLVMFDTSCFELSSSTITTAVCRFMKLGLPTLLLRSHLKLDFLGIEYARLGSVTFLIPLNCDVARRQLVIAIAKECRAAARYFGLTPPIACLYPRLDQEEFHALNRRRVDLIRYNNLYVAKSVRQILASICSRVTVRTFGHGLYFTLDFPSVFSADRLQSLQRQLVELMRRHGIDAKIAASFGWDCTTLVVYQIGGTTQRALRVAVADHPDAVIRNLALILGDWAREIQE